MGTGAGPTPDLWHMSPWEGGRRDGEALGARQDWYSVYSVMSSTHHFGSSNVFVYYSINTVSMLCSTVSTRHALYMLCTATVCTALHHKFWLHYGWACHSPRSSYPQSQGTPWWACLQTDLPAHGPHPHGAPQHSTCTAGRSTRAQGSCTLCPRLEL